MTHGANSTVLCTAQTESTRSASADTVGPSSNTTYSKPRESSLTSSPSIWISIPVRCWVLVRSLSSRALYSVLTQRCTGWLQSTIGEGKRSTSATSYLAPKFVQRNNLHVLLHAQVSRLVDPDKSKGVVTFGGVQFLQGIYFVSTRVANAKRFKANLCLPPKPPRK